MDVAIIGTGAVGSNLGAGLGRAGHRVVYGSRTPGAGHLDDLLADSGPDACALLPAQAAAAADTLVLAVPWPAALGVVAGLGDLDGKVLLDPTNAIGERPAGAPSTAALVAHAAPGARVVKAFNTLSAPVLAEPRLAGLAASMFVCGDDGDARARAAGLGRDLGFDVIDCGGLAAAEQLEHLARLSVHLSFGVGLGPDIAFRLLRR